MLVETLPARVLLSTYDPSAAEQEMLEWVNRMRIAPQAHLYDLVRSTSPLHSDNADIQSALDYFDVDGAALQSEWSTLTPVAPLAWNAALISGALGHNQAMIGADLQSHQVPGELGMVPRLQAAGYTNYSTLAENIFAYGKSPLEAHAAFAIDWGSSPTGMQTPPGHRENIMRSTVREVGISIVNENNPATGVGPLVITQDFGSRFDIGGAWLVGVVFDDTNQNARYTAGEGLAGVTVQISRPGTATQTTTTMTAGGYQALLQPGTYTVTFSGGALPTPVTRSVTVGAANVKLDYVVPAAVVVNGTTSGDVISVAFSSGDLIVTKNGVENRYLAAAVSSLTINGLAGNDTITIGTGVMGVSINGNEGADLITGGDGADLIYAGSQNDTVYGGAGNDTILGNFDADSLFGQAGDDQVQGGLGADTLNGDDGHDTLHGGDQSDLIYGGAGNDSIEGKGKADIMYGGIGNDTIIGGAGADLAYGDAGDDRFEMSDTYVLNGVPGGFPDTIFGGTGIDTLLHDGYDIWQEIEA